MSIFLNENDKIRKFPEERYSPEMIFKILSNIAKWNRHHKRRKKPKIERFKLRGDWISLRSKGQKKYWIFKRSLNCAHCGVVGRYFVKERCPTSKKWHLSLYGVLPNGKNVLMTLDHRIPKSRTGCGRRENLQTMCYICNKRKENRLVEEDVEKFYAEKRRRQLYM